MPQQPVPQRAAPLAPVPSAAAARWPPPTALQRLLLWPTDQPRRRSPCPANARRGVHAFREEGTGRKCSSGGVAPGHAATLKCTSAAIRYSGHTTHLHLWKVREDARPRRCRSGSARSTLGHGQRRWASSRAALHRQPLARREREGSLQQLLSCLLLLLYTASCSCHSTGGSTGGCAGPRQGLLLQASRLQLHRGAAKGRNVERAWHRQVQWARTGHEVQLIAAAGAERTSGASARRQGGLRSAEW